MRKLGRSWLISLAYLPGNSNEQCFFRRHVSDKIIVSGMNSTKSWTLKWWLTDAKWRHRSGSTLTRVMDCCLTSPNYYLRQYWLGLNIFLFHNWLSAKGILWHSPECDFTRSAHEVNPACIREITHLRLLPHFPAANELSIKQNIITYTEFGPF